MTTPMPRAARDDLNTTDFSLVLTKVLFVRFHKE
jgi:hypothetical protein